MHRRAFLSTAAAGLGGATLAACGSAAAPVDRPSRQIPQRRGKGGVLLAYFSRAGENYYNGGRRDLEVGNTEVLARMIARKTDVDLHRIVAADPYSDDYDETVQRNVEEENADARPRIRNGLRSIAKYDTVLLASPIWNSRTPMIMATFAERYDFAGKRVLPVVTYAVSGLGSAASDYADLCDGASIGRGLAVRGERVRASEDQVDAWLRRARLAS